MWYSRIPNLVPLMSLSLYLFSDAKQGISEWGIGARSTEGQRPLQNTG